ncbi:MAG: DUF4446 family protein [Lachnospiraceae bacterium]|nr:DUF4446 family protein [Lachnospiraceae bacterium]
MENSLLAKMADIGVDPVFILIGLIILIIILFVLLIKSKSRIKKIEEKYEAFMRGKDGESLESVILTRFDEIDKLKRSDVKKTKALNDIIENLDSAYQKVGIIKYDAFNEMGGKLSFVLALLTKENDGFILNAVHSREACYTYVKEIVKGESYIPLADEEQQALEEAVKSDNYMME